MDCWRIWKVDVAIDSANLICWCDGDLRDQHRCAISIASPAILFGESAFETVRVVNQHPLYLTDHLDRLEGTVRGLGWSDLFDRGELLSDISSALAEIQSDLEWRLRITLIRQGESAAGLDIRDTPLQRWLLLSPLESAGHDSVTACISKYRKIPPDCFDPDWKHGNYLSSLIALREACSKGFDEAILLSTTGMVTESAAANLFWIIDGELWTCSADGIFSGLCRGRVLTVASHLDLVIHEGAHSVECLLNAEEAFLTSSIRGIVPISQIESRQLAADHEGSLIARISDLLHQSDQEDLIRSAQ